LAKQDELTSKKQPKPQDAQQAEQKKDDAKKPTTQAVKPAEASQKDEKQQANEQWLNRIPDDPAGLLRRKFKYQYGRNQ
jgi:Ca-activated chloride channel family protein